MEVSRGGEEEQMLMGGNEVKKKRKRRVRVGWRGELEGCGEGRAARGRFVHCPLVRKCPPSLFGGKLPLLLAFYGPMVI